MLELFASNVLTPSGDAPEASNLIDQYSQKISENTNLLLYRELAQALLNYLDRPEFIISTVYLIAKKFNTPYM